jgi:SRSO17 transposase
MILWGSAHLVPVLRQDANLWVLDDAKQPKQWRGSDYCERKWSIAALLYERGMLSVQAALLLSVVVACA